MNRAHSPNWLTNCLLPACLSVVHGLSASATLTADEPTTAERAVTSNNESLGDRLLDDLDPQRFNQPPAQQKPSPQPSEKRILPNVHFPLPGEDIGQPSGGASLARVRQGMRTAQSLLAERRDVPQAQRTQHAVVAELDALIEQLSRRCQGGACQNGDQQQSASGRSPSSVPKLGSKPGKAGRGNAPARDSTTRLGQADRQAVDMAEMDQLLKDLWGHLPPRAREQMLQSYSDEFLPKYELEIEKYFRRLATEKDARESD